MNKNQPAYSTYAKDWAENRRLGENLGHRYVEKPAMFKLLKKLKGKKVICIGCGSGEECNEIHKLGFKVTGVDLSPQLIQLAKDAYPDIEFSVMDMEKLNFPKNSFDIAYSSLAIHYVSNWQKTLSEAYKVLKPGGTMLVSTQHPTYFGSEKVETGGVKSRLLGYEWNKKKEQLKTYGDVVKERKITVRTRQPTQTFIMKNFYKPFSAMVNNIAESGFEIIGCVEPTPTIGIKKKNPNWFKVNSKLPLFIIFELRKPKY